ncbi:hypothetical protein [Streptomyces sp. NPDC010273]|uniref:hypothetical protein n=1 Tax=Streptomyces sp. NPDC010273 TaxID=3364829 RepID=UPI0036EDF8E3
MPDMGPWREHDGVLPEGVPVDTYTGSFSTAGCGKAACECFGQEARLHISRLISTSCATVRERVLADAA